MTKKILYICAAALLIACNDDAEISISESVKELPLSAMRSNINSFIDTDEQGNTLPATRANIEGTSFEEGTDTKVGDMIRLNIVAPFVDSSEYGESTWGNTFDNWRHYEWKRAKASTQGGLATGSWTVIQSGRGFDFDGDLKASNSHGNIYSPQATPYVYTATTWTEEIHHIISSDAKPGGSIILSFSNIFKADQRRVENYKASDVLWAQSFMQAGTENITLSFQHKMAALKITLSDDFSLDTSESAPEVVMTLENMPDIDQQEIIIGNYYAARIKSRPNYGEWQRSACSYEENGKVLGIVSINQSASRIERKALTPQANGQTYDRPNFDGTNTNIPLTGVEQSGTYTAYKLDNKTFLLIIPPYTVPENTVPTLWLRQGKNRWSAPLPLPNDRTFESGTRYNFKMKKPTA